jgi:hypothetical protein
MTFTYTILLSCHFERSEAIFNTKWIASVASSLAMTVLFVIASGSEAIPNTKWIAPVASFIATKALTMIYSLNNYHLLARDHLWQHA